ncbi:MAG: hypothetical protein FH761_08685 [Firmicutes bacterium]|nr:hypothetical protein [Bacillota bacterium]
MKSSKNQFKIMKWVTRIISLVVILIGLPFYFGYGNPMPFINEDYTLWDNLWLTIFPLMFIGLGLGWKYEKIGGYLVTIPISLGLLFGLIVEKELITHMLIPLVAGILFLIQGYKKES